MPEFLRDDGTPDGSNWLPFFLIFGSMAAVAYADYIVVSISLGYLYVLPLGISVIFLRKEICYSLTVVCVFLHDLFGPPYTSLGARIGHNLTALVGFVFVVAIIQRYAAQRNALAREVRNQRDDLLHDVELAAQVQRMFLPGSQPSIPGLDVAGMMQPARAWSAVTSAATFPLTRTGCKSWSRMCPAKVFLIPIIFQQLNFAEWPQFCDHSVTSADVRLSVGPISAVLGACDPSISLLPGAD